MPLDEQHAVIERVRAALDPPAGVTARVAGLPVLAAEANAALASPWRRIGTLLAGLLAVGLVLLAVHRRLERAWVPLVPIALATGWSAVVLFALRIPLNPMSATLGALVIALSTEFAVLLDGRFREERAAGHGPAEALRRTYASTGAAVLASGATAIAGFAVLAFSDVRMLREFGIVTVVDLSASLLGVLAVLPAALVLAERRAARARVARARPPRSGRARVKGGWLVGAARRRRARLHHPEHAPHRGRRLARAGAGRRRCRRSRCRSRRSRSDGDANIATRPTAGRRAPAGVHGPRARRSSTSASSPSRARSCSRSSPRGPSAARSRSTCSTGSRRASPTCASPRSSSAATTGSCGRAVRERGWSIPVGYDHDGAVANLYGVAVCPTMTFARRGGEVAGTRSSSSTSATLSPLRAGARRTAARCRWHAGMNSDFSGGSPLIRSSSPRRSTRASRPSTPGCACGPRACRADGADAAGAARAARARRRPAARGRRRSRCGRRPVPWAYRVLFRHLGLDPDVTRTPVEALVLERLVQGGHAPHGHARGRARARHARDRRAGLGGRRRARRRRSRWPPTTTGGSRSPTRTGPVAVLFAPPLPERAPSRRTRALLALRRAGAGRRRPVRRGVPCGRRPPRSIPLTRRHEHRLLRRGSSSCLLLAAPAAAQDVQTLHYEFGPVKIKPGQNTISLEENALKPPVDGWITRFTPNLVRSEDGSVPRVDVIHLHHGVWLKNCQPLFAAGEEKTTFSAPPGLRLALPDHGHVAHEPHDPQPHADAGGGLHHLRPRLRPGRHARPRRR